MCAGFLCLKIRMARRRFIATVASLWVSEDNTRAVVHVVCHIRQLTRILASCGQFFHAQGRSGEWDKRLALGNPAADQSVKDYLRCVTREQLQARVTPKQATPFFVHKLTQLSLHLQRKLDNPGISSLQKFVIARDQAYFKTAFFSGDRPGDLSHVKVPEILRFPNDDGFLFNHIWGKTLRDGDQNVFGIRRNPHTAICPIRGIEQYMDVAQQLSIDLSRGYLFRPKGWNPRFSLYFGRCRGTLEGLFERNEHG